MMGRNHIVVGACALEHLWALDRLVDRLDVPVLSDVQQALWAYLGIPKMTIPYMVICLGAYFLGSLLPDIDHPDSILGRFVHIPVAHRTWLHSIYPYLLVLVFSLMGLYPVAAYVSSWPMPYMVTTIASTAGPILSWLFIGSFTHLFWDSFSAMGNCWFYKLLSDYKEYPSGAKVKKGHKLKLYHAGEWSEYVLVLVIIAFTVASFVYIERYWI